MSTSPLSIDGPFGIVADRLIELDLPALPVERRDDTVAFVVRRAQGLPSPLKLGVSALSLATGGLIRLAGIERTTSWLTRTRLPFVGELARLVRSLGMAFVWETWPSTRSDGSTP